MSVAPFLLPFAVSRCRNQRDWIREEKGYCMLDVDLSIFPELESERLLLRELSAKDADAVHAFRSDEQVMKHIGRTRSKNVQDSLGLIERIAKDRTANAGITWGIVLKESGELIGTIGFYRMKKEHFRAEIGYVMASNYWGRGLMSEAIQSVVKYGFDEMGLHSIEADTDPLNTRSMKVLQRNGFTQEGLFRESYFFDGKFFDSAIWSRLATDPDVSL